MTENNEGWALVSKQQKAHYYRNGRSLCGRWSDVFFATFGVQYEQGNDDSPDNCVECRRRLIKLQAKEQAR